MRILIYTHPYFKQDQYVNYLYQQIEKKFPETEILAVDPGISLSKKLKRYTKKIKRLGPLKSLELISSIPLARSMMAEDSANFANIIKEKTTEQNFGKVHYSLGVNSNQSQEIIAKIAPDFIIQAGAGILGKKIFSLAKNGTINIHHGIAPSIRGMDSSYWAKWYKKPEWLGATVHYIDDNIDTGKPIYYAESAHLIDKSVGEINALSTFSAVAGLIKYLESKKENSDYDYPMTKDSGVYLSSFSGWKLLLSKFFP